LHEDEDTGTGIDDGNGEVEWVVLHNVVLSIEEDMVLSRPSS
jgi:hypothetical protein